MSDLNNIDNKDLQKLFEDWDKAGVMPHTVMNLNSLLPKGGSGKKILGTAAGLIALAGVGLGKGAAFLGKQAFMKRGFLKVLRRIGEMEEYVIKGEYADKFKYPVSLRNGEKISSIKHYDEIKNKVLQEIKNDIKEFDDFDNSSTSDSQKDLNNKATLVNIINKYKKFFSNLNMNFNQINSGNGDEDIYNSIQNTVNENMKYADTYINKLIEKYKKRFTVGKEENPYQNKRLDKYIMALQKAWDVVKKEIIMHYKKLAIEINRSPEFKALYDKVDELYKSMPIGKNAAKSILNQAEALIGKGSLIFNYKEKTNNNDTYVYILNDSSLAYVDQVLKDQCKKIITVAISNLRLKNYAVDDNEIEYILFYDSNVNGEIYFEKIKKPIPQFPDAIYVLNLKNDNFNSGNVKIKWRAKFDIDDSYYPIEGKTIISNDKIKMVKV